MTHRDEAERERHQRHHEDQDRIAQREPGQPHGLVLDGRGRRFDLRAAQLAGVAEQFDAAGGADLGLIAQSLEAGGDDTSSA